MMPTLRGVLGLSGFAGLAGLALGLGARAAVAAEAEELRWHGYGELLLTHYDYPQNPYRDRSATAHRDSRATIDLSKVSLEGSKQLAPDWQGAFELIILHEGIAGTEQPNNGGPFNEDHAGGISEGALRLSHIYLSHDLTPHLLVSVGRVPVAVGLLALADAPNDYLGSRPFEAELSLIPEDWASLGVSLRWTAGYLKSTTELVSGLDSTGFDSYTFVAAGEQGRYGFAKITEPSFVQRVDLALTHELAAGASYFFGETAQNRPTPDMTLSCQKHNDHVAPCGYEHAPLILVDAHAVLQTPRWTARFLALWGSLKQAATINRLNLANSTNLPDIYSPVGAKAYGIAAEAGYNLWPERPREQLVPFLRFDRYNTIFEAATPADQKPLFDRRIFTAGISWRSASGVYGKFDISHRRFGDPTLSYEDTTTVAAGLVF